MLSSFRTLKDYFLWRPRGVGGGVVRHHDTRAAATADEPRWDVTVSFSCGGWFHVYFFGVAHALVESGVLERWEAEGRRVRFCGSSVGSLVAACLAAGQYDFEGMRETVVEAAQKMRASVWNVFTLKRVFACALDKFSAGLTSLDHSASLQRRVGGGRLEMSVTILPRLQAKLLRDFTSYADIREALQASCCIVPFIHMPFKMRRTGEWVVDGAVANFTPRITEPGCISISPMYFQDASVHPHIFVPMWWAIWPPHAERYRNLFWMGYNDMLDYLATEGWMSEGEASRLQKPETDLKILESYWDLAFTIVMECLMLIWVRPVGMLLIYTEFLFSFVVHTVCRFVTFALSPASSALGRTLFLLRLQPQKKYDAGVPPPRGACRRRAASGTRAKHESRTRVGGATARAPGNARDAGRGLTPDISNSSTSSLSGQCMTPSKAVERDTIVAPSRVA